LSIEHLKGRRRQEIKPATQCVLWGRAAGRCEFQGCNKELWKSPVTQEPVGLAEKAHIYAYNSGGARGNTGIPKKQLNTLGNLMLVCPSCHKLIDKDKAGVRYSAKLLQNWKRAHEARVKLVTGISPDKKSHVIHYSANIDAAAVNLDFNMTASALFPRRYPAEESCIDLGRGNVPICERTQAFWEEEGRNLDEQVKRIHDRIRQKEIRHLSFFALAPQPLLIKLGSLFPEVFDADVYGPDGLPKHWCEVYAHHKSPRSWCWKDKGPSLPYRVTEPENFKGNPVLVFALSARISPERVLEVAGQDALVWTVSLDRPHNDFLKTRKQLDAFSQCVRPLLDEIRFRHGDKTPIRIFPAMPAAAALQLGRIRSPKASADWLLFDAVQVKGGFVHALTIKGKP